uniref:Guanylate cyclase domain-containing protein n=1 Tax=Ditylum brightwellii TaxID=49249 RepID=A0A7S4W7A5_9STRA
MLSQSLNSTSEEDDANQDQITKLKSSIERFSCHIPLCIARYLEDHPFHDNCAQDTKRDSVDSFGTSWDSVTVSPPIRRNSLYSSTCSTNSQRSIFSSITFGDSGHFPLPVPNANSYHRSALLLVDISGFTRLSTLLDVESLSNAINTYFELLITQVEMFGGDVLKFAGDAFFAEWRDEDNDDDDLEEAVCIAASCGWSITQKYSGYAVPGLSSEVALLDVHCGIGVGELATLHVGDNTSRREFLFLGDPIDQVSAAEALAENGQVAASPDAIAFLKEICTFSGSISPPAGPQVITSLDESYFEPFESEPCRFTYFSQNTITSINHQMSLYVHQAARNIDDVQGKSHNWNRIADAEIRRVYTIFVKPQLTPRITGNKSDDHDLFMLLNEIMVVTLKVISRFKGHLRQFIVDDKGVVLIATFGQRGATFPNLITEKGLPATIAIHDALKINLNVNSHIGATFGKAYCGVVGGSHRHEFAVLGSSVNLAARLMCSKDNPGILVDDAIRMMASSRFDFLLHPPVTAKGYSKPVPIFEPQSSIERQWNKVTNFVGREAELKKLVCLSERFFQGDDQKKAQMVFLQAHSGLGKSSLAMEAMNKIRRLGRKYGEEVEIQKTICKDGEEHVPFCVASQIILQLLHDHVSIDGYGIDSTLMEDVEDDLSAYTENSERERLKGLCAKLGYPVGVSDLLCEKWLGVTPLSKPNDHPGNQMTPEYMMNLIVEMFLYCTKDHYFVLLAIDDVHWMDSLSWKVIEQLLNRGKNLLIVCISRPIAVSNEAIDREFLTSLLNADAENPQFTEINLSPFTKNNVRNLIALSFECQSNCIDDEVCDYLYEQTGGMPYFAQEVIGNMIRNDLFELKDDGTVCWRSESSVAVKKALYANVNDLFLHRLDRFKSEARTLLQVCAVLGFEFSLLELLSVQSRVQRKRTKVQKIHDVLQKACLERILMETCRGGRSSSEKGLATNIKISKSQKQDNELIEERSYRFSHAIWRNCVLGTMLRERKRDLHRLIATIMEKNGFDDVADIRSSMKLFGHLRESGQLMKATRIGYKIGKYLSSDLLHRQSIDFCLGVFEMWKDTSENAENDELVEGKEEINAYPSFSE